MKSVLLAEDVADARLMLRLDLEIDGRFAVVGEAATGEEAAALSAALRPDAVILDLSRPRGRVGTIEAIQRRSPASRIIALTSEEDAPELAGAHALLDRRSPAESISWALTSLCDLR
jgi:DNA-binding NarL/FixJ family response regulator